jgi:TonB family protein
VIHRHVNELRFCHEKELGQRPQLQGKLWVRFVIALDGRVSAAVVARSTLSNPKVEACAVAAFRRWTFPSFGGQELTVVTLPVAFELVP